MDKDRLHYEDPWIAKALSNAWSNAKKEIIYDTKANQLNSLPQQ